MGKRICSKVANILQSRRGISLIVVLCTMLLLMTIGASVLVSASNTASAARAREDSIVRERYAKELAVYFNKEVVQKAFDNSKSPIDIDKNSPFFKIPQRIYEVKKNGGSSSITVSSPSSDSITSAEIIAGLETKMETNLVDQQMKIIVPYQAAVKEMIDGVETELVAEILGVTEVTAKMNIIFTVKYKEKDYKIVSQYAFEGQVTNVGSTSVDPAKKEGFTSGEWTLLKYDH